MNKLNTKEINTFLELTNKKESDNISIGNQLIKDYIINELKNKNWTYYKLAKQSDIDRSILSNWFNGSNKTINVDTLLKLLSALNKRIIFK